MHISPTTNYTTTDDIMSLFSTNVNRNNATSVEMSTIIEFMEQYNTVYSVKSAINNTYYFNGFGGRNIVGNYNPTTKTISFMYCQIDTTGFNDSTLSYINEKYAVINNYLSQRIYITPHLQDIQLNYKTQTIDYGNGMNDFTFVSNNNGDIIVSYVENGKIYVCTPNSFNVNSVYNVSYSNTIKYSIVTPKKYIKNEYYSFKQLYDVITDSKKCYVHTFPLDKTFYIGRDIILYFVGENAEICTLPEPSSNYLILNGNVLTTVINSER